MSSSDADALQSVLAVLPFLETEAAVSLLTRAGGDAAAAVALHLDGGDPRGQDDDDAAPAAAQRPSEEADAALAAALAAAEDGTDRGDAVGGEEGKAVRAPIAPVRGVLSEDPMALQLARESAARARRRGGSSADASAAAAASLQGDRGASGIGAVFGTASEQRSVGSQQRKRATPDSAPHEAGGGSSVSAASAAAAAAPAGPQRKRGRLAELFRPPAEIMCTLTFDLAKEECTQPRRSESSGDSSLRWLMVNLLEPTDFACHVLNRDLWSDASVRAAVAESFVFCQWDVGGTEAQKFLRYYPSVQTFPAVAVIDGRTGELMQIWDKSADFQPGAFKHLLAALLKEHPLTSTGTTSTAAEHQSSQLAQQQQQQPPAIDRSEEEQLALAIAQSMAHAGDGPQEENSDGSVAADAMWGDYDDEDEDEEEYDEEDDDEDDDVRSQDQEEDVSTRTPSSVSPPSSAAVSSAAAAAAAAAAAVAATSASPPAASGRWSLEDGAAAAAAAAAADDDDAGDDPSRFLSPSGDTEVQLRDVLFGSATGSPLETVRFSQGTRLLDVARYVLASRRVAAENGDSGVDPEAQFALLSSFPRLIISFTLETLRGAGDDGQEDDGVRYGSAETSAALRDALRDPSATIAALNLGTRFQLSVRPASAV